MFGSLVVAADYRDRRASHRRRPTCGILATVMRLARLLVPLALLGSAACTAPERGTVPATPSAERAGAPAVHTPVPAPPPAAQAPAVPPVVASAASRAPAAPPVTLPPEAVYVCVVEKSGEREQTVIEFAPKVRDLCKRHPEMGPCQYERNQCRTAGGRVYARGGEEITLAHEAEYDRKVLRVRFRSN
jgi:hypothetical protein